MIYSALKLLGMGLSALLTTIGILQLAGPLLQRMKARLRTERRHLARMKHVQRRMGRDTRGEGLLAKYRRRTLRSLELMLRTTRGESYKEGAAGRFLIGLGSCAVSAGLVAYSASGSVRFALFAALLCVGSAIAFYRVRLRSIQIQGGYDLADAAGVLAAKYKVSRGNMRSALRAASSEVRSPLIRRHFLRMVREEMNYTDPAELEAAVEEFVYSIGTSFARQLGLAIWKGLSRGEYVESTLASIDRNIHKNVDMLQDEGDSSSEVLQLSWLHLILFPLLIVFMVMFMGWSSTLHYQLETETGRSSLTTTLLFIAASLLLALWFRKPPNDY